MQMLRNSLIFTPYIDMSYGNNPLSKPRPMPGPEQTTMQTPRDGLIRVSGTTITK